METILVGVGELYIADVGTAFPALDTEPGVEWKAVGYTQDGVTVTLEQSITEHRVDQETGPVKASRTEEGLLIATNMAEATLDNLAKLLGRTIKTTAADDGQIGTEALGLYRGSKVARYALLFRGNFSEHNEEYPAQYQIPVGYFSGNVEAAYTKDGVTRYTVEFRALVDPNAASDDEKFGSLIVQSEDAL